MYHRLSLEMHKQMIQTLSKSLMAALKSKLQLVLGDIIFLCPVYGITNSDLQTQNGIL